MRASESWPSATRVRGHQVRSSSPMCRSRFQKAIFTGAFHSLGISIGGAKCSTGGQRHNSFAGCRDRCEREPGPNCLCHASGQVFPAQHHGGVVGADGQVAQIQADDSCRAADRPCASSMSAQLARSTARMRRACIHFEHDGSVPECAMFTQWRRRGCAGLRYFSSFTRSALKLRMPSESFSVAI